MSSSIWTLCAGDSEIRPLRCSAWRVVEAQHHLATRRLVDTAEEQVLLEEMIDRVKPPDVTHGRLHYLLSTPFRYPPLAHGSRFGRRHERALWYGSTTRRTAFAELAYYRLLFLEGSRAELGTVHAQLTAFTARARTTRGVDLTRGRFAEHRTVIASPSEYAATQQLGGDMRTARIDLFRFPSARDPDGGINIGVLTPAAFGSAKPSGFETWHCTANRQRVELVKRDYFTRETLIFQRDVFLVDGRLPAPAL